MATQVVSERFDGQYHGVIPPTLLPKGWISDGGNVRKVSQGGGWKGRKGCALHDTSALESGAAVKSLHYYINPFSDDEHFIAQVNSKLVRESAQGKLPPEVDTSYGTTLGVAVGTTPGFSAQVGEWWFYADGSGRPMVYGGATPRIRGLFVHDTSEVANCDYSRKVIDGRADTYGVILEAADDYFIVLTEERLSAVIIDLSNPNTNDSTLTVQAWRSGAWTTVSGKSDGTDSTGAGPGNVTLGQDGTISWTASSSDLMRSYLGIQGYAYKFSWNNALSNSVYFVSVTCTQAATSMTNKWNGEMNWVSGARFYDNSLGEYIEYLGKVTNESSSMYMDISEATTSDFLYIKTPEPATIFGIGVVNGYGNVDAAAIDRIEYWNGSAWTAVTTNLTDETKDGGGTKSFAQTGTFAFDASAVTPQRRLLEGDQVPGYWYRISWAVALSTDVRIYAIAYGAYPETLPYYNGCVEFKGRLLIWGDPEYPNRLRYSARDAPFCFNGMDSGYTDTFGDMSEILCAVKFYNELIVFKKHGVWLLEGESPGTFGTLQITNRVGLASLRSVVVAEIGFPGAHKDEAMTIAIWQDIDGIYTFDGRKTKKESYAVDNYFNPESGNCIAAASIRSLQAFNDSINNEYHLLLPSVELVFNYVTAEWYPPWDRKIVLATGLSFRANDNREYTYAASADGFVMRLETDTSDKTTANVDEPIDHSVKTRAVAIDETGKIIRFGLRRLLAEFKTQTAGSPVTKTFKDLDSTGVTQAIPQAMSMVESGYNMTVPHLTMSIEDCRCFQVEFSLDVVDQEMEIYSFGYEISGRGLSEQ
jgi:hypothetical protein